MKTKRMCRVMVICLAAVLALPGLLRADVFLKYRQQTEAFEIMGQRQPAEDTVQEVWVTKEMMRTDTGDQTIIMRLDRGLFYVLDHTDGTYLEMPLDFGSKMLETIDEDEEMDEEEKEHAREFIQHMMEGMRMSIAVEETGEKQKVGEWNCTRYIQTMEVMGMTTTSDIWATRDIRVDYELLAGVNASAMLMMPGMQESLGAVIEELSKIEGVAVLTATTTSVMGTEVKGTQELLEYSETRAPEGFYDPPKGYTRQSR